MSLKVLIKKDFYDMIRDPRIWIPMILGIALMPLLGLFISLTAFQSTISSSLSELKISIYLYNYTDTPIEKEFILLLKTLAPNMRITPEIYYLNSIELPKTADNPIVVINMSSIPGILSSSKLSLYILAPYRGSLAYQMSISTILPRIEELINTISTSLYAKYKNITDLELEFIKNPASYSLMYYEPEKKILFPFSLAESFIILPLIILVLIMMIVMSTLSYSAISTAVENEEKTMEILLTMPLKRELIILSKSVAGMFVGILGSVGFGVGYYIYIQMFTLSIPSSMNATSLNTMISVFPGAAGVLGEIFPGYALYQTSPPLSPIVIGILIFYIALSGFFYSLLGVFIGAVSSDVRISQSLSSFPTIPLVLIFVGSLFIDLYGLPDLYKFILLSNPVTGPLVLSSLIEHPRFVEYSIIGSIMIVIENIAILLLISRLFLFESLERYRRKLPSLLKRRITPR
ncbi:MAG: ABC transporter permease [Sulfolobales archaeon]